MGSHVVSWVRIPVAVLVVAIAVVRLLPAVVQNVRMNDVTPRPAPWDGTQTGAFALIGAGLLSIVGVVVGLFWDAPRIARSDASGAVRSVWSARLDGGLT